MYNIQDASLLSAGMKTLNDSLGTVRAEVFITLIKQSGFDYTKWREDNLWANMSSAEISEHAEDLILKHFNDLPDKIKRDVQSNHGQIL